MERRVRERNSAVGMTVVKSIFWISTVLFAGTVADVTLNAAHNTTVVLTCVDPSSGNFPPAWIKNGSVALTDDGYTSSRDEDTGELIGTLTINGNHTCGTFYVHCVLRNGQILHNTSLTVEGCLPPPEDIHINESNNSLAIEWNSPYSAINTNSSVIHVDPHITQYTVYIVDNYTGNYTDKVNITETSFRRNISDDNSLCPMYGVTAWNSGGEGDMSELLPGNLPRIPNSIEAEDVNIHTGSGALDIHLHVTDPCAVRRPDNFLVTVKSTDGVIITTVQHKHPTIHILLPQDVNECDLNVAISAENRAGVSIPTEIPIGCQTASHSTATTQITATTPTTTWAGSITTSTDLVDSNQQGHNNIIYIAVGVPVGALVIVTACALLLIILWKCRRKTKGEPPVKNFSEKSPSNIWKWERTKIVNPPAENIYTKRPSLGGSPLHQPDSTPTVVDVTTESQPNSPPITHSSAGPQGNPQVVYARIDPAKHSRPQPPASDNQVQYAQIQYQD